MIRAENQRRKWDPRDVEAESEFANMVFFYPHIDMARASYLYEQNRNSIDLSELDVYFNPKRYARIQRGQKSSCT